MIFITVQYANPLPNVNCTRTRTRLTRQVSHPVPTTLSAPSPLFRMSRTIHLFNQQSLSMAKKTYKLGKTSEQTVYFACDEATILKRGTSFDWTSVTFTSGVDFTGKNNIMHSCTLDIRVHFVFLNNARLRGPIFIPCRSLSSSRSPRFCIIANPSEL